MSENGEIYTAGKNFTLPPALTAWTNSTSEAILNSFVPACPESGQSEIVCKSGVHDLNLRKIEGGRRRTRFKYTHPLFSGI